MTKTKFNYLGYIFLLSVFVAFLILNIVFPLYSDDWSYSFIFGSKDKISSISDIFYSQYVHYFTWGGRVVAHTIAQFLLLMNPYVADFLNAFIYTLLIYLIYVISVKSYRLNNFFLILIISLLVLLFVPEIIETTIWITGSANYLWTCVLLLIYIRPFIFNIYLSGKQKGNSFIFLLYGVIVGCTNENTSFSLIIISLILLFYYRKKYTNIPTWAIVGTIGVIIGFSIMILSPGNFIRKDVVAAEQMGHTITFTKRIFDIVFIYIRLISPITFIYLFVLTIYLINNVARDVRDIFCSVIFVAMGHISVFIMLLSPVFPDRAAFGSVIFILIGMCILINKISLTSTTIKYPFIALMFMLILISSYKFYFLYNDVKSQKIIMNEINNIVDLSNNQDIIIKKEDIAHRPINVVEFSSDSTFWLNKSYAKYKNINTFVFQK